MRQVKVKRGEWYEDSQGSHFVCKGKIIFISNSEIYNIGELVADYKNTILSIKKPIIISESEDFEIGDYGYDFEKKRIVKVIHKDGSKIWLEGMALLNAHYTNVPSPTFHKVLAFPENFSNKHLNAIINDKIKNGDLVYLEIESAYELNGRISQVPFEQKCNSIKVVKTDYQSSIKIFSRKKETNEEEFSTLLKEFSDKNNYSSIPVNVAMPMFIEFINKNYTLIRKTNKL